VAAFESASSSADGTPLSRIGNRQNRSQALPSYYRRYTPFSGKAGCRRSKHPTVTGSQLNLDARAAPRIVVCPKGSLGEAYKLREMEREARGIIWTTEQRSRDDWPRAWRWLGPVFGDFDPQAVAAEDLLKLRMKVSQRISEGEAHRVIKVWRALWKRLPALPGKYGVHADQDPSLAFANRAPDPRQEVWPYRDVLRLVQRAWRERYYGLAAVMAVAWDTMLSPIDVRKLTARDRRADDEGAVFFVATAKTGRAARGTLTRWSEAVLDQYLAKLGVELHDATPIFWSRGGVSGPKGGRPWPPHPYTKDRLGEDFRHIRALAFGEHDERQLQDMRRSGAVEADAGGTTDADLSNKMANTLSASNRLRKTYNPVNIASVRRVDEARSEGRRKNRNRTKSINLAGPKVSTRITGNS
jgi:hypothetical protein